MIPTTKPTRDAPWPAALIATTSLHQSRAMSRRCPGKRPCRQQLGEPGMIVAMPGALST
ncbi:hypothetical protein Daura_20585 [Dactylosporangium aurantiacum]|uniref:Uncharacterized protein n=1 Tax=Dactylosporangium aurantiacum TaxID=35754 RepID=A0A9Q9MRB8_9ACTN|nr:hypothetical protein [Dactylosporangium aurantiacum]UWZ58362.1 hypothetical protein Daura_20585 [Dactylosporangium aurantiacum]